MERVRIGQPCWFQHRPGGPVHACTISWTEHPPANDKRLVMVRFTNGSKQWVDRAQLHEQQPEGVEPQGG